MRNIIKKILKEDEWDWVRHIDPAIELKPNTIYYFEPPITKEELYQLSDRITNSKWFKEWLIKNLDVLDVKDRYNNRVGMKYFVTKNDPELKLDLWSLKNTLRSAKSTYPFANVVNARKTFHL